MQVSLGGRRAKGADPGLGFTGDAGASSWHLEWSSAVGDGGKPQRTPDHHHKFVETHRNHSISNVNNAVYIRLV